MRSRRKRELLGRKVGRPRKYPELIGPPKPKRVVFNPVTVEEKWIVRSRVATKPKKSKRKNLSVEYYKTLLVTHCPLLGIELSYEKFEGNTPNNYATLDRIDSTLGYEEGNVQIISFRANTLKSNATLEELKLLVKNWEGL